MSNNQNTQTDLSFRAKVLTDASKELTKSNGATYVLHNVEILNGPAKGSKVAASRTLVNAKGEKKDAISKGEEVLVYAKKENGKWFFNISSNTPITSNEELDALFTGVSMSTQDALEAQAI